MVAGNGRARVGTWIALAFMAGALGAVIAAPPAHGTGARLGVYLDDSASLCSGELLPFGQQTVYICGFPPPDSIVGGALLTLQRPAGISILAVRLHRDIVFSAMGNVDQVDQVDLRFRDCIQSAGPLVMMEVDLYDGDLSGPRPDLTLHLIGAGADSLAHTVPQWKICDPNDPEGSRGVVPAAAVDAVFNCTSTCACTTPVKMQTWTAVKELYRER